MSKSTAELPMTVAAAQLTNALMKGYLEKKRPSKKLLSIKYQRRWCLVYGNYFMYYDSPDDKVQKGSFSLEGYKFLPSPGSGQYGFSLVSKLKRHFEFMAPNEEDFRNWNMAINKGICLTVRTKAPIKTHGSQQQFKNEEIYSDKYSSSFNCVSSVGKEMDKLSTSSNKNTPARSKTPTNLLGSSPRDGYGMLTDDANKDNKNSHNAIYARPIKSVGLTPKHSPKMSPKFPPKMSPNIQPKYKSSPKTSREIHTQLQIANTKGKENKTLNDESDDDTDDDDDGYIKTEKLNLPKLHVKSEKTETSLNYTEDDYMTVFPDSTQLPFSNQKNSNVNKKHKNTEKHDENDSSDDYMTVFPDTIQLPFSGEKNSNVNKKGKNTENHDESDSSDDYMTVLETPVHQTSGTNSENPYVEIQSDENASSQVKTKDKIYSSVKRPKIGTITQRSESDYAIVGGFKTKDNDSESNSSSDDIDEVDSDEYAEDEHDYVTPNKIDFSKFSEIRLPQPKGDNSCSSYDSSDSGDSSDSDGYMAVDDYAKVDQFKRVESKNSLTDVNHEMYRSNSGDGTLQSSSSMFEPLYANF